MVGINNFHVEFGGGAEGGGGGGTGGFLVNAHQYILEKHTSAGILDWTNASDTDGAPRNLIGDQLSTAERAFMSSPKYLRGFDPTRGRCNDSGMTILRIGSMNLMLHIIPLRDGIESPQFYYMDSLSKSFDCVFAQRTVMSATLRVT